MIKFGWLMLLLWPLVTLGQKLQITGNISGLPAKTLVKLVDLENPVQPLAETQSQPGKFVISAKLEAPALLGLLVGDDLKTAVFVGNESVSITGSTKENADDWQFKGSKIQDDFIRFQREFSPIFETLNEYGQMMQTGMVSEHFEEKVQQTVAHLQSKVDSFISARPSSPVSAMVILSTIGYTEDLNLLDRRARLLTKAAMSTAIGGHLKQALIDARFNSIGSVATDFSQPDTSGKSVSLAQFRGKYVLVDFWASWCGPCRRENPNLVRTFHKFKSKNFTILGVSLDEEKERWMSAIKRDQLQWTQVSDLKGWENAVAMKYKIRSIPRNLLVGPDGKILAKDLRGEDLEAKLESILVN